MDSNNRNTYIGTAQYIKDMAQQMQKQPVFQPPYVKSILSYFYYTPQAINTPQAYPLVYQAITKVLLTQTDALQQLVRTALHPQSINVTSSRQPCLSAKILRRCPALVLDLLERGNQAYVFFEFLREVKNETALGYFEQMFDHQDEKFQTVLIKYFAGSASILELLFEKAYHQEVFFVLFNAVSRSADEGLVEFKKELFVRFLNKAKKVHKPEELIENVMDMMGIILENLLFMRDEFVQLILDSIETEYIDELAEIMIQNYKTKPEIVEYQVRLLSFIISIFYTLKTKNISSFNLDLIEKTVIAIVRAFERLTLILFDVPKSTMTIANGETVPRVGMVRYYLFVLFRDILKLDEVMPVNNPQFLQNKHRLIEHYLCLNRWNNMMHHIVEECALLLLKFERVSKSPEKHIRSKKFLDFLIEHYKASEYIFLGTGNTSSYGNIYYIYNIARAVAVQLQSTFQLQEATKRYRPLQKFIFADLQNFEIKMDEPLSENASYMVKSKPDSIKKLVRKMSTREYEHSSGSKLKLKIDDEVSDFMAKREKTKKERLNSSF